MSNANLPHDIRLTVSEFWDMRYDWELVESVYYNDTEINYNNFGDSDGHHFTYGLLGRVFDVLPEVNGNEETDGYPFYYITLSVHIDSGYSKIKVRDSDVIFVKFFSDEEWLEKINKKKELMIRFSDENWRKNWL